MGMYTDRRHCECGNPIIDINKTGKCRQCYIHSPKSVSKPDRVTDKPEHKPYIGDYKLGRKWPIHRIVDYGQGSRQ